MQQATGWSSCWWMAASCSRAPLPSRSAMRAGQLSAPWCSRTSPSSRVTGSHGIPSLRLALFTFSACCSKHLLCWWTPLHGRQMHWPVSCPTSHRFQISHYSVFTSCIQSCWMPQYSTQSFRSGCLEGGSAFCFAARGGMQGMQCCCGHDNSRGSPVSCLPCLLTGVIFRRAGALQCRCGTRAAWRACSSPTSR